MAKKLITQVKPFLSWRGVCVCGNGVCVVAVGVGMVALSHVKYYPSVREAHHLA